MYLMYFYINQQLSHIIFQVIRTLQEVGEKYLQYRKYAVILGIPT